MEHCQPRIKQLETGMRELGRRLGGSKVRAMGMMGVVEINDASGGAERAAKIVAQAYQLGLFLRPRGRAVYLWPPLTSTTEELDQMFYILKKSIQKTK